MKRNKWKRAYDQKCEKLLGMTHQTAMAKLERMWLLDFARKAGFGNCYHCTFPIESEVDMSVEHIQPWGGNKAKGLCEDISKFWDIGNLRISHKRCNSVAGQAGTGKYKYTGVHDHIDNRRNPSYVTIRGMISVDGKNITLGGYSCPEKAAIAYDIALMAKFNGIGKLNFEQLRDNYQEELKSYNTNSNEFWKIGKGKPIKELVEKLYPLLWKNELKEQD